MTLKIASAVKIEKNVAIPPVEARQGSNARLLQKMEVGDSVFFDAPIAAKAVRYYRVAKRLGIRIVIRKVQGGVRMWRVSGDQPVISVQTRPAKPRSTKRTSAGSSHGRSTSQRGRSAGAHHASS